LVGLPTQVAVGDGPVRVADRRPGQTTERFLLCSERRGAEERHRDGVVDRRLPLKADIVKVEVPGAIAADIRRRGMPATRNSTCVIGTPTMRNRLTPP